READRTSWLLSSGLELGLAAVALLCASLLARYVLRPCARIEDAMRLRAQGKSGAGAPMLGDDEIGRLARTLNEMLESLEQRVREIESSRQRNQEQAELLRQQAGELRRARDEALVATQSKSEF